MLQNINLSISLWDNRVQLFKDYVWFSVSQITIVDVVDILLLSGLIYIVYKFIRDRHAGRAVLGLGLLVVLYVISDVFNMVAINSILRNFYAVGIIALCILFQPELRDVLEEFGATTSDNIKKFRNRHITDDERILNDVNEICKAAFDLSDKGEGALIVIERQGTLRNQMSEGTPIDAVVSHQLLCNIFVNKSPLHDGAVIIRDGRIVCASSKSKTIAENGPMVEGLGTRHRAALKISEVSDAIVVVVSEETGTISVANNKLLKRHYEKESVHKSGDLKDDLFKLITGRTVAESTSGKAPDTHTKKQDRSKATSTSSDVAEQGDDLESAENGGERKE